MESLLLHQMIKSLKKNQVFVFGSNMLGSHGGGAARQAKEQFGAEDGIWNGMTGQSYAIPTLGKRFEKLPLSLICSYLSEFADYTSEHTDKEFLLTPIGTGIAGFTLEEIKSILPKFTSNVIFTDSWNE